MSFVPKGRSAKVSIQALNTNSKSKVATPPSFVTKAAKAMKLGDGVRINYSSLGGKTWMTGLTRIPAPSKSTISGQSAADRFTFVGARKTRTSAGIRITVLARKGSNLVSFQTPLEPIDSSKNSGSRSDGTYNASESLSDKIAQFSAGDIVALKYNNRGFQFVLSDINPYLMTATGTLTHTTEKIIRRTAHTTAYLRTGKIKIMLVVPQTNRTGGADAATLTSTLKSLGKQEATFTYYKHKGLMWIAQITPR